MNAYSDCNNSWPYIMGIGLCYYQIVMMSNILMIYILRRILPTNHDSLADPNDFEYILNLPNYRMGKLLFLFGDMVMITYPVVNYLFVHTSQLKTLTSKRTFQFQMLLIIPADSSKQYQWYLPGILELLAISLSSPLWMRVLVFNKDDRRFG